ncbi:DUF881 domain-containing protein [Buchananella hordeovulneris]|uniref:Uncharacterized protein n=1 Tax=Buchananella hordeovulneris TaxID=52770 RepID=A0A1Q5PXR2_9ACTO|nr:DUF881 domain-containing protein [Buchananella hordeovulneris]MDO5079687.1 DUF881 domain-containing protein [Buchananella hordeovulneris]OKL52403.1 hypothetical protein BSZ40_02710 [Buchananella hordeovulneris]RRD45407.1 DUF881 domain-containing protein [Buchananella hordeovulneris]RRD53834.1 DUF881 domain-containing protein [Buchananella hordeovulneris]
MTTLRRPDASMSVLRDILENPFAAEAQRLAVSGQTRPPLRPWSKVLVVLTVALGTTCAIWSAQTLNRAVNVRSAVNARILEQIAQASARQDELRGSVEQLGVDIDRQRTRLIAAESLPAVSDDGVLLQAATAKVVGEGITIILRESDAANAPRVRDRDIAFLVNSLFASGAEAVSVNGHRIASTSAIRTAGKAILVDLKPLLPPYRIEAIGQSAALEQGIVDGEFGEALLLLKTRRQVDIQVSDSPKLTLEAINQPVLREAK